MYLEVHLVYINSKTTFLWSNSFSQTDNRHTPPPPPTPRRKKAEAEMIANTKKEDRIIQTVNIKHCFFKSVTNAGFELLAFCFEWDFQSSISISLIRWFQIATPFQLHGKCNLAYKYRCLCSVILAKGKKNSYCSSFCMKPLFPLFCPALCPWHELRWHVFTVVQPGLSLRGQKDIPPATPSPCTRQLHYASWPRWFPTPPWFPHPHHSQPPFYLSHHSEPGYHPAITQADIRCILMEKIKHRGKIGKISICY